MALIKKFQAIYHPDKDIQDIQANIKSSFDSLQGIPFLDGILLKDITVSTAVTNYEHKLNRAWTGYFITKRSASVNIWTPTQTDVTKFISIDATGVALIDLWVF